MTNGHDITINRYIPFVCLYFFFNSLLLPEGLLYTMFLTPVFLYHIAEDRRVNTLVLFTAVTLLFMIIHLMLGVNTWHYVKSYLLALTVGVFCLWFYGFCQKVRSLEKLFIYILWINIIMVPLAFLALSSGILKDYFWYLKPISPGIPVVPRLKLFTYEASYYSLLLVPVACFVVWRFLIGGKSRYLPAVLGVVLLLGLSFSLGVIAGLGISLAMVVLLNVRRIFVSRKITIITVLVLLLLTAGFIILYWYYPDNPFIARIKNITSGRDTSGRGRTYEAFELAFTIAKQKSIWFGVGLGQIKELGRTIIIQYYQYTDMPEVVRIPNAVAETLAMYGIVGVIIRFAVIAVCFFKTRVFHNYYRLSLFIFVFVYQFTGSYIFNIAEYVIWILAFSPVLPQFDKSVKAAHG